MNIYFILATYNLYIKEKDFLESLLIPTEIKKTRPIEAKSTGPIKIEDNIIKQNKSKKKIFNKKLFLRFKF